MLQQALSTVPIFGRFYMKKINARNLTKCGSVWKDVSPILWCDVISIQNQFNLIETQKFRLRCDGNSQERFLQQWGNYLLILSEIMMWILFTWYLTTLGTKKASQLTTNIVATFWQLWVWLGRTQHCYNVATILNLNVTSQRCSNIATILV